MVTDKQVKKLLREFNRTGSVQMSALKSGMHRNTASKYLASGRLPSQERQPHTWRTREDPFADVWPGLETMLESMPELQATTLFDYLQQQHPGRFSDGQIRTLQRRVREYRALHGPDKEVFFEQERQAGELIQFDWMDAKDLVTIGGEAFPHLLMHSVFPYSNWEWATIAMSESFLSLKIGLQEALFRMGGVPRMAGSDNTSAATHQIEKGKPKRAFNKDYKDLLKHLKMDGVTITLGCPNENGDVESMHGHLRRRLKQALLLRGSRDFSDRDEYERFLAEQLCRANSNRCERITQELKALRELPFRRLPGYEEIDVSVGPGSTVRVKKEPYSVPSRLIGRKVHVRIFEKHIEVLLGRELVHSTLRRSAGGQGIHYEHLIDSLVKKPGAFRQYRYRDAMFPSGLFLRMYEAMGEVYDTRRQDREYLQLLKLASDEGEERVARLIQEALRKEEVPSLDDMHRHLRGLKAPPPMLALEPCIASYDTLLNASGGDR